MEPNRRGGYADNAVVTDGKAHCPSAQPDWVGSVAFGVVQGTPEEPELGFLDKTLPAAMAVEALAGAASPTDIFRFAAPCAQERCCHFDGSNCHLVSKMVEALPEAVGDLPRCAIRKNCLWFKQEGKRACLRCPQITTEVHAPSEVMRYIADPQAVPHPADANARGNGQRTVRLRIIP